jgi:hypothetical protein
MGTYSQRLLFGLRHAPHAPDFGGSAHRNRPSDQRVQAFWREHSFR